MKRLAIVASLLVFAACAPKADEAKPADAAATAAPMDSSMQMDSTKTDSTAAKSDTGAAKK